MLKAKRLAVKLPEESHRALQRMAEERKTTPNQVALELLERHCKGLEEKACGTT